MSEGRQPGPDALQVLAPAVGEDHARAVARLGQDQAPRVDDHRAAVARAVGAVAAGLGGGGTSTVVLTIQLDALVDESPG